MLDFMSTTFMLMALSATGIHFYSKYSYNYWDRRGVPYLQPTFPFGNFGEQLKERLQIAEQFDIFYHNTTSPFIGVYAILKPVLVVRDPDLIRNILIKDFQHFVDRGVYHDKENDPLTANLFTIEGDHWKDRRRKFTPTFSGAKMKAIFSTLLDSKQALYKHLTKVSETNEPVEVRELAACYTTNVIASVAFGIDVDTLANPNDPFRKYGRQFLDMTLKNAFRFTCFGLSPSLLKWSGLRLIDHEVEEFFSDMVNQTLELREQQKIVRKDFFQLLVQLRNNGPAQKDDDWETTISNNKDLSLEELAAQAFVFYVAGFETTSSTISFSLYEIAKHPEIQDQIHVEIDNNFAENGEISYDTLNEFKYLEAVIDETLRKYPPLPQLNRICTKDYNIPGTNITIEKGTSVIVPIFSLQRDEKYYPDPLKFDPLRFFGKTNSEKTYLPFGCGQRSCIGMRMGKMSTKVGLYSILQKYRVELGPQHDGEAELQFSGDTITLAPKSGIYLKFIPRNA